MKKLFPFLFAFVFLSCSHDNSMVDESSQTDLDTNFVDMREAISMATLLEYDVTNPGTSTRSTTYLDVESAVPIGDTDKPSYYIVNYANNSGFVIIAADKRAEPVLAFSTEGSFDIDTDKLPGGLVEWMSGTKDYIQDIRESNTQSSEAPNLRLCVALKSTSTRALNTSECSNSANCPVESISSTVVGPLLETAWSQGVGFNDSIPILCDGGWHVPAGCVAIAMAQVMYYHKYPSTYNWAKMLPYHGGSEASRLIRDLGLTDALHMDYGCDGSFTDTKKAESVFKKNFGYSSATYGSFNSNIVQSQLKSGLPVILRGEKSSGEAGHAWVCDGFIQSNTCTHSTLQLHMNWGWGSQYTTTGKNFNGWYGVNDWNSPNGNFNQKNDMVYNIKP
ncbi:C10 family peptidase [Dysgonomonas macrotermitis]|uniref:Spi protease inhibitor n=1 Tax=Dysgonomonas macrotermitis TaxID=1346286 RepID=A0A1M5C9A8_9BACT|nr:C10 family peptidase [Dysgonomonas macrotermitis]SHF51301.1 Spi protease inhibitor [Dysgonomonas macrotermitis]